MVAHLLSFSLAILPLTAPTDGAAQGKPPKEPEKKVAYVPIRAFPAAGKLWQVGWREGERFHPVRLLLGPDGTAIAVLSVENETLGGFTALLRLSGGERSLRLAYRDSLEQGWEVETEVAVQFAIPCPIFARDLLPKAIVRPEPAMPDG